MGWFQNTEKWLDIYILLWSYRNLVYASKNTILSIFPYLSSNIKGQDNSELYCIVVFIKMVTYEPCYHFNILHDFKILQTFIYRL